MKNNNDFMKMQPNESFEDYCHRISSMKEELELTWDNIASIINKNTGNNYTESKYRKQEKNYCCESAEEVPSTTYLKDTVTTNYEKGETTSAKVLPLNSKALTDQNELLRAHGFDPNQWEIKTASNSKVEHFGGLGDSMMYSSRITVKPKTITKVDEIKEVGEYFKNYISNVFDIDDFDWVSSTFDTKPTETLLIPLADLHWLRKNPDELNGDINVEYEKSRIIQHYCKYIERFRYRNFKRVILVIGQDFFNSSFTGFTSSQRHLQSNALEYKTMFKTGCELMIDIIEMFRNVFGKIEIIGSLGNHDNFEGYAMFKLVEAYYHDNKNVTVDAVNKYRKYLKIGSSCVGLGHLDKEGDRAFGLMQCEVPELWASTKCHIFIAGHLHHLSIENKNGVEIYRVPTITEPDDWTDVNGYTCNNPKSMAFIFDEEEGLTETHLIYKNMESENMEI